MPQRMPMRYTVALEGFSDFERTALASFFRLAERHAFAYEQAATLADSDFIIADADHPAACAAVAQAGRAADTVFIGHAAPAGAGALLSRPIDTARVARALDALLEQRLQSLDTAPSHAQWLASEAGALHDEGAPGKDVLVVEDSRIALRFLQVRLQRLGYRVAVARSAAQAMELLAAQPFALVFLDVMLGDEGGVDGFALCRHIKQRSARHGPAPGVVMVTARDSATDRVRGQFAGCDAYLTKPLMESDFLRMLRQLDPAGA